MHIAFGRSGMLSITTSPSMMIFSEAGLRCWEDVSTAPSCSIRSIPTSRSQKESSSSDSKPALKKFVGLSPRMIGSPLSTCVRIDVGSVVLPQHPHTTRIIPLGVRLLPVRGYRLLPRPVFLPPGVGRTLDSGLFT